MLPILILFLVSMVDSFWMTAELLQVDWREGCLTTAGCSQPRFKVLKDMLPLNERISISWPVFEHFVQEASRSFVSHWAKGKPEDLALSCQVVGTDPTYGFPRVCDQTASIRVFQEETNGRIRRHQDVTTIATPEEELGKKLVEIRAKCFNVTLAVQKHTDRCPWCPDPSDVTIVEQRMPEELSAFSTSVLMQLGQDLVPATMLILAIIAILASLGFAFVLIAFLRQKRTSRQVAVKPRYQPFSPAPCGIAKEENRYDLPWEHTRPLAYWLSSSPKSEATTTSPLESTSSIGLRSSIVVPHNFRSGGTVPQTRLYHYISSNSSTSPGRDSGLGSV
ncbi:unnamed protein product [Cylicocyclus nassatus]|uniref:C2 domain-containing protein n=1 Tax=Cylicocyclus nassatus TaxID=53992 RepID=A0AA36M4J5_CYLNA|nr:unnamed protein product [Cylicocyclus nassatus]